MRRLDKKLLFKALGFLGVIATGKHEKKTANGKAELMSGHIEDYCREQLPEVFYSLEGEYLKQNEWILDLMIRTLKKQHKEGLSVDLPTNQALMDRLFNRLQERQRIYLADREPTLQVEAFYHLLEQENRNVACETKITVTTLEGDPNAFVPYAHMSSSIVTKIKENGECTKQDLEKEGFTSKEIKDNWNISYALAKFELLED